MTRDEFRKKIATPDGRAELGLTLTGDEAAAILADDTQLDQLLADIQARAAAQERDEDAAVGEPLITPTPLPVAPPIVAVEKRKRGLDKSEKLALWIIAGVVAGLVVLGVISTIGHQSENQADSEDDSGASEPYVPPTPERAYPLEVGYHDAGNGLEWQFGVLSDSPDGCSYYKSCVIVKLKAFEDCPSGVYVEGQVMDASGTVVGMTNDTLPSLMAGQDGRVTLGYMGQGAQKTRVTDVVCH
ncbi:hypothetical protein [Leifsonia soli]|uniref:Uncharacterized protein n=1 Tax=Leifsonia soli TaxID=582665 RepID=A0A852T5C7_9MICO|nr:hypothetical protein [Leifsonia soli]NYD76052.1 hypothetical protein [Leifsonia soli]